MGAEGLDVGFEGLTRVPFEATHHEILELGSHSGMGLYERLTRRIREVEVQQLRLLSALISKALVGTGAIQLEDS